MDEIQFYRCMLCGKIVGPSEIRNGEGCRKCGGRRVAPANLSFFEKIGQIIRHPFFWRWENV